VAPHNAEEFLNFKKLKMFLSLGSEMFGIPE
jgi:hypothetical protein